MKIAYLDCFSGISGDMFLGALVDAGVPVAVLEEAVSALGLDARIQFRRVDRSGISSAKIDVLTADGNAADGKPAEGKAVDGEPSHSQHPHSHEHDHSHEHSHSPADGAAHARTPHTHGRSLSVIQSMIRRSALPAEVQRVALNAFQLLGDAEAKIHNVPVESIHFHEVGATDAIVDIVATAAGCHWLGVQRWLCSPLNVGGGHVHCAHGKFPVPAPATLELLRDLPVYSSGVKKELVTPTGAALLRALDAQPSSFPQIRMTSTGYGAGSRDLPGQPNVLRLVVGEAVEKFVGEAVEKVIGEAEGLAAGTSGSNGFERIGIIETTIDDATPELVAYVAERLLAAGASDVLRTPVQMKKGRSGIQLTVLCAPAQADALQRLVFRETTTLGLRYREETKRRLERCFVPVKTPWGAIQVKVGMLEGGEVVNYAPEYEECRQLAEQHGVPLKRVMQAANAAYLEQDSRTK